MHYTAALSLLCLATASQASPLSDSLLAPRDLLDLTGIVGPDGRLLGGPGQRIPIPLLTYNRMELYTRYAANGIAPSESCVKAPSCSKVVDFISTKETDSQATIFQNEEQKEFIIAFPGTHSVEDSHLDSEHELTDIATAGVSTKTCHGCKVHTGFQKAWNAMVPAIKSFLDANLKKHHRYTVTLVGHSLGGGIASIATASLTGQGYPVGNTYTFGQPRTGNQQYADHIDKISGATELIPGSFYRVTHANDGVPQWPSTSKGYVHHRTEYWQRSEKLFSPARTFRCFGQEPPNCNLGTTHSQAVDAAHSVYTNIKFGGRYGTCPGRSS